ncbi:MAG: class I SAM-dependent methyltransferase [Synergistaceae bacterium]|nr:class I SAM-dependent methyltransferase [Synergistaceae bacterium]
MNEFIEKIVNRFPLQKNILDIYLNIDEGEKQSFLYLLKCVKEVYNMNEDEIIDCYGMLVNDTLEESKYFYAHGRYRYSTFKEVDEYMKSKKTHYMRAYQIGLLITLFLWPNHTEMRKHFVNTFKGRKGKKYLEVGVGHGYYFSEAVDNSNYEFYFGIDINEDSLNMTSSILRNKPDCQTKCIKLELLDFFKLDSNEIYDAIVSGEILEHVEEPWKFLRKFAGLANENTLIYVTTAINAPAIDHISLFRNPDDLHNLFKDNGLRIVDMQFFLYQNKPLEACIRKKLPVTVAIIAKKA